MRAKALFAVSVGVSLAWGFPTMSFPFGKKDNSDIDTNFIRNEKTGVVIDKKHNLMYSDGAPSPKMTFQQAQQYCADMQYAGYNDWQLPTKEMMYSLLNNKRRGHTIKHAFKNVLPDIYWSGTEANYNKSWYFDYNLGRYGKRKHKYKFRAFCVRKAN